MPATACVAYSVKINNETVFRHLSTTEVFRSARSARAWAARQAAADIKLEAARRAATEGELVAISQPSIFVGE